MSHLRSPRSKVSYSSNVPFSKVDVYDDNGSMPPDTRVLTPIHCQLPSFDQSYIVQHALHQYLALFEQNNILVPLMRKKVSDSGGNRVPSFEKLLTLALVCKSWFKYVSCRLTRFNAAWEGDCSKFDKLESRLILPTPWSLYHVDNILRLTIQELGWNDEQKSDEDRLDIVCGYIDNFPNLTTIVIRTQVGDWVVDCLAESYPHIDIQSIKMKVKDVEMEGDKKIVTESFYNFVRWWQTDSINLRFENVWDENPRMHTRYNTLFRIKTLRHLRIDDDLIELRDLLVAVSECPHIESLAVAISFCHLGGSEDGQGLCKCYGINEHSGVPMDDPENWNRVCKALASNQTIKRLSIRNWCYPANHRKITPESQQAFAQIWALNTTIKFLLLDSMRLIVCSQLFESFEINKTITHLLLHNCIQDDYQLELSFKKFAQNNQTITFLSLFNNHVSGGYHIEEAFKTNETITHLILPDLVQANKRLFECLIEKDKIQYLGLSSRLRGGVAHETKNYTQEYRTTSKSLCNLFYYVNSFGVPINRTLSNSLWNDSNQ
ncbi:hypothetical protein PPL_05486 [Heterostelium album PN500]|uniref:Uncharacterized protein n=1 Tax=Heterostelium pallidum (strain ATCC 26659 / Pp 5 / PN500) TaxID=670386 RepID=D3BAB0_HETP5|nr:hypothetical protein PPL_05486 [Heterostelium album PN500]EFA81497.1 hypothetical protein PPL_05486 [Heterostelium album PN500]|eukprot:XP_020433614.1 hypothetical protein PPL_05486 [Heterostelium album PN500]